MSPQQPQGIFDLPSLLSAPNFAEAATLVLRDHFAAAAAAQAEYLRLADSHGPLSAEAREAFSTLVLCEDRLISIYVDLAPHGVIQFVPTAQPVLH